MRSYDIYRVVYCRCGNCKNINLAKILLEEDEDFCMYNVTCFICGKFIISKEDTSPIDNQTKYKLDNIRKHYSFLKGVRVANSNSISVLINQKLKYSKKVNQKDAIQLAINRISLSMESINEKITELFKEMKKLGLQVPETEEL